MGFTEAFLGMFIVYQFFANRAQLNWSERLEHEIQVLREELGLRPIKGTTRG